MENTPIYRLKKHINIGDIYMANPDDLVWTILGSCVSIVLFDEKSHRGAICHAQMPGNSRSPVVCNHNCTHPCLARKAEKTDTIYVNCAISVMIDKLKKKGLNKQNLKAYLFGGASIHGLTYKGETIASMNVKVALEALKQNEIRLSQKNTGGNKGRRLIFDFKTGKATVAFV